MFAQDTGSAIRGRGARRHLFRPRRGHPAHRRPHQAVRQIRHAGAEGRGGERQRAGTDRGHPAAAAAPDRTSWRTTSRSRRRRCPSGSDELAAAGAAFSPTKSACCGRPSPTRSRRCTRAPHFDAGDDAIAPSAASAPRAKTAPMPPSAPAKPAPPPLGAARPPHARSASRAARTRSTPASICTG